MNEINQKKINEYLSEDFSYSILDEYSKYILFEDVDENEQVITSVS